MVLQRYIAIHVGVTELNIHLEDTLYTPVLLLIYTVHSVHS